MNGLGEINAVAILFMAGVLLVSGVLLLRAHRHLRQQARAASDGSAGPRGAIGLRAASNRADLGIDGPHASGQQPFDPDQWEVRMYETARALSATLDSKMVVLEQLIREADRAAARLEAAREGLPATPPPDAIVVASSGSPPTTVSFDNVPANVQLTQAAALGPARSAVAAAPLGEDRAHAGGNAAPADRYQELYVLADYGYPAAEIAHRVGMPAGEVELILSLRGVR